MSSESSFELDVDNDENPETENPNQESSPKSPNQADKISNQQQQRENPKLHPADEHFSNIIKV